MKRALENHRALLARDRAAADPDGLLMSFVVEAIYSGAEEWDNHTSAELFGSYITVDDATFDADSPDGTNEILFGNYSEPGVIAVTIVWMSRIGKRIIEFDIMFDIDFPWGNAGPTSETELGESVMDLQNIATHELGHGAGLADLYDDKWSEQTMYGYATYGETKKRTLNTGDIAGIQALYG